jgi:hypothetical protein
LVSRYLRAHLVLIKSDETIERCLTRALYVI